VIVNFVKSPDLSLFLPQRKRCGKSHALVDLHLQYLMGISGAPALLKKILRPLASVHWLFLTGVALMTHGLRHGARGPSRRRRDTAR
jgi:hypothetical protein